MKSDASASPATSGKRAAPHEAATSWRTGVKFGATRMVGPGSRADSPYGLAPDGDLASGRGWHKLE